METRKLLIADGGEEFRQALKETLQGTYQVQTCRDGKEALSLLRSYRPDILVLDLMLPELDGISLLQNAMQDQSCPVVLATSRFINDYVLEAAGRLGVSYLIRKPCDIRATAARILDLSQCACCAPLFQSDPRSLASNLLPRLGVPPKRSGYRYLREAIPIMAKNPHLSITKELYPAVAALCQSDGNNVEHAIRSAIHTAWEHRDDRLWQLYFPPDASGHIPRPTNAGFILRLADSLALREETAVL